MSPACSLTIVLETGLLNTAQSDCTAGSWIRIQSVHACRATCVGPFLSPSNHVEFVILEARNDIYEP